MSTTKKDDYYHVGLTDDEVLQSREKNGVNLLTPPKRPSLWKLYLEKFEDPVVRVLLVAAVFSLIISIIENEYAETIGIIAAILLATGIGFFFEYDANKKFDLLNAVNEETLVKVIATDTYRKSHVKRRCRRYYHTGNRRRDSCRRPAAGSDLPASERIQPDRRTGNQQDCDRSGL